MSIADGKPVHLNVIIVGAGIAGLSAALAFKQNGHIVSIFERSSFKNEVGAAITISPNGTRVLQKLNFDFSKAGGVDIKYVRTCDAVTLVDKSMIDLSGLSSETGAPHQAFHRVDLHGALVMMAGVVKEGEVPVKIYLGAKITDIDVENARIELDDGTTVDGDLLIGADGLHSIVRKAATKSNDNPYDSGWMVYRYMVPREKLLKEEVVKNLKEENMRRFFHDGNPLSHGLIWYDCRNGDLQNLALFHRGDSASEKGIEDFHHSADKSKVLKLFSHFHPNLQPIIQSADNILCWPLYDREPLATFVYGKTLLVGDAAHPMTPFTAQGGVQAMEDAGAILALFSNLLSKDVLRERLAMFDKVRLIRTCRIQCSGMGQGKSHPFAHLLAKYEELDNRPLGIGLSQGVPSKEGFEYDFKYNVFEHCESVMHAS